MRPDNSRTALSTVELTEGCKIGMTRAPAKEENEHFRVTPATEKTLGVGHYTCSRHLNPATDLPPQHRQVIRPKID